MSQSAEVIYDIPPLPFPTAAPRSQHQQPCMHSAGASVCRASDSHRLPEAYVEDGSINVIAQRMSISFILHCKISGPTLRMRSSTLSWGNERMAAMVRMSRSDKEYLL